jgi:hypothetical protein
MSQASVPRRTDRRAVGVDRKSRRAIAGFFIIVFCGAKLPNISSIAPVVIVLYGLKRPVFPNTVV